MPPPGPLAAKYQAELKANVRSLARLRYGLPLMAGT
jgi:hypothetical protein